MSLYDEAGNEFADVVYFPYKDIIYCLLGTKEPETGKPIVYEPDETDSEYIRVRDEELAKRVFQVYMATTTVADHVDGPAWFYQPKYVSMEEQAKQRLYDMAIMNSGVQPAQPDKFCRNCGTARPEGARFCPECASEYK